MATLGLFSINPARAQLTVSSAATDSMLVRTYLVGPGVVAKNIHFTGANAARGTFNCSGTCNVGLPAGIMLTSGSISNAIGPNNSASQTTDNGLGGDADLASQTTNTTFDASVLEFDFACATDSVQFRFVFGSEEYSDFVGSGFNDVFGFFLSGPGITGKKNIALIPGTTTAVSINNVNNGYAPGGTVPTGPCQHCTDFRDNTGGTSIQYDGMTTVLTAASKVSVCDWYHIKLAISDVGDHAYDSGVFLEANSFQSMGQVPLLVDGVEYSVNDTVYMCPGDTLHLGMPTSHNYHWNTGDTTQFITVTDTGGYVAWATNSPVCFAFTSNIRVMYPPNVAAITASGPVNFCAGDSVTLTATPGTSYLWSNGATSQSITVSQNGTYNVTVHFGNCTATSPPITTNVTGIAAAITPSGPLTFCQGQSVTLNSSAAPNYSWSTGSSSSSIVVNNSGTYTLTVTSNGCSSTSSVIVVVNANPTPAITGPASVCQGTIAPLNAGSGYSQYAWSGGQTSSVFNASISGTYTVTVTNASGCTGSANFNLVVHSITPPVISGAPSFCAGQQDVLTVPNIYTNYQWSNGGSSTNTLNVATGGSFTVTVTDVNGCTGKDTMAVTMNPLPSSTISGPADICQGSTGTLSAPTTNLNYNWSTGVSTPTITVSNGGTYLLTVTDGNGCSTNSSFLVNVNPIPTVTISGSLSFCQNSSTSLICTSGMASYVWSNGSTGSSISANSGGQVWVRVQDLNGCTGTDTVVLTVNPLPTPSITGALSFCTGNSTTLQSSSTYTSYLWSDGSSGSSLNASNAGPYTLTVTDANNCTGSVSVNVTVNSNLTPVLPPAVAFCDGNGVTLQPGSFGGYQWSDGSVQSQLTVTTAGNYSVMVTDAGGCTGIAQTVVTVNPNPTPSISGPAAVCAGTPAILDAGNGYTSYAWNNGLSTFSIQPAASGNYSVIVTDMNGCTGSANFQFTVNNNPVASISGPTSFCAGNAITLQAGTVSGGAYAWSDGSVTASIPVSNGGVYTLSVTDNNGCTATTNYSVVMNALPQPSLPAQVNLCAGNNTVLQPGTFASYVWSDGSSSSSLNVNTSSSITVTVTDNNGCVNSTQSNVTVYPNPTPTISGPAAVCDGVTALLDAGNGYANYSWSDGSTSQTLGSTTSGTYTVTVSNPAGCSASTSFLLTVNPLPVANVTGNLDICRGSQTTLNATPGQGTYVWSNGSATSSITVGTGGSYTLTVTSAQGCSKTTNAVVNEHMIPAVNYTATQSISCDELLVSFNDQSTTDPGSYYTWQLGDGTTAKTASVQHRYLNEGDYMTRLDVISPYGCAGRDSMLITIVRPPLPHADFKASAELVNIFNSGVQFTNQSTYATHYRWNFGDGKSSEEKDPYHLFDTEGDHIVKLIAWNGTDCYDESEVIIHVAPWFIPNGFTPNNDGKNDVFFDGNPVIDVQSFHMDIFDRWGQAIYHTDNYTQPWDGYLPNGKQAPVGVYTYYIAIVTSYGKLYEYRSHVTLIR